MARAFFEKIKYLIAPGGGKKLAIYLFFIAFIGILIYSASKIIIGNFGEKPTSRHIIELMFLFAFFCPYRKTFFVLILPAAVFSSLYGPFGRMYGPPDFQALSALLATNTDESREFLSLIPIRYFFVSVLPPVLLYFAHKLSRTAKIEPWRNKTFLFATIAALIYCASPVTYFSSLKTAVKKVEDMNNSLQKYRHKSTWGKSVYTGDKATDYILVIGESVQRDFLHLYGYPVKNTPFLSSSKHVTAVSGLSSGHTYTIGSLRLMLTQPNGWTEDYTKSFIDLAKSAGIQTVWISNQGLWGKYDTPVSTIAQRADNAFFPNKKGYDSSNLSDFVMLDRLKKEIVKSTDSPRLFVLHMLGSHPNVCKRISDIPDKYNVKDHKFDELACYSTSILKTDRFLEKLYLLMSDHQSEHKRKFSIIYFSDHGLSQNSDDNGKIHLRHDHPSKFNFRVPLVRLDPETESNLMLSSEKSPIRFTDGLGSWLHIQNSKLHPYNLFDGISDPDDLGLSKRLSNYSPATKAIDISSYIVNTAN